MTDSTYNEELLPLPGDYKTLIADIAAEGYEFPKFLDFDTSKKHVLLRHDVDISIDCAHQLALVEHEIGVKSAYFVLLRSNFYNPFSGENTEKLREIIALGHDIGLHIDLSIYNCRPDEIHGHVVNEARMLSELVEVPIYLVSFHRPSTLLRNVAYEHIKLPGFVNLYEPSLFRDIGFVSDSRGGWYHGHPLELDAVKQGRSFQLLTHPIWWVNIEGETAVDLLNNFAASRSKQYMNRFRNEFRILR